MTITLTEKEAATLILLLNLAAANIGGQIAQAGLSANDNGRATDLLNEASRLAAMLVPKTIEAEKED